MQMTPDFDWDHVAYWEHYKGGKYTLCDDWFGWLEEDLDKEIPEDMKRIVTYKSLENGKIYHRRYHIFFESVVLENGTKVPRFRAVTWKEAFLKHEGRIL